MIQTFKAFLDFCYIARRAIFSPADLIALDTALQSFHHHRKIFQELGVRSNGFSIPRMHSMVHYKYLVQEFGAPNGLCSSITESRHITAVKKPWRRSSRWNALGQMLRTNQRLDKLAAMRADFVERGMLAPSHNTAATPRVSSTADLQDDEDCAPVDDIVESSVVLAQTRGMYCNTLKQPFDV